MAKERRRRRRERKGGKKLDLEISKKISAMLSDGSEAEEETAEPETAEPEAAEPETAEAQAGAGSEPATERPAAEEPAAGEPAPRKRRTKTLPPDTPPDALEDTEVPEAVSEEPASDAPEAAGEPAVVKIEDRRPADRERAKPPPRPRRRRGDRRSPGSPMSDHLEAGASDVEAKMAKKQKLMGLAKIGVAAVFFFFFGYQCDSMFTARSVHNERIEDAVFLKNKINEIYTQVTELQRIYERKKRKQVRFTRDLVDLATKKGPDSINRQFVDLLGEVEQRLKNMHPQTVGDIIEFHNQLTGLAEAIKDHAVALDEDDWTVLMQYSAAEKLPKVKVAIVVDPPEPKPGVDIFLERGEAVIVQEVVKRKRSRAYKVHKIGRTLPLYELAPEQLQMAKLDGYVNDDLRDAIEKYQKGEKKILAHLDGLMKSRSSLMTLIQKFAESERMSEF